MTEWDTWSKVEYLLNRRPIHPFEGEERSMKDEGCPFLTNRVLLDAIMVICELRIEAGKEGTITVQEVEEAAGILDMHVMLRELAEEGYVILMPDGKGDMLIRPNYEKRFYVYSGASAFYLVDLCTGQEACLGDGVDTLFDEEGYARTDLDSQAFVEDLARGFNSNQSETLEAYFPETFEKEAA